MDKKDPKLVTFGCRLNTYESEVMLSHAKAAGLENVIIFNTCAVTKEAERQSRQAIRRARKENPQAQIIVTGCSAQIDPHTYAQMDEVDRVIGNDLKLKAEIWRDKPEKRVLVNDIMMVKETVSHMLKGFENRARAIVQVQNGCNHRCTFCIIPYGRGNSRSVPVDIITDQVRILVEQGYKEIVFTGVDITSYGADLPEALTLGQMIRRILSLVPELPRLRLSSLDSVEIDKDLWYLIENEPRFMPYLHLSLQSGDNMVLKRMKRRHLREDMIEICNKARNLRPEITFGADIIAGFPTETEEMFQNTLNIVEECDLTFLHVFPYSERDGTPAAKMPQVDMGIRKERAARLRDLGQMQLQSSLKNNMNKTMQAIVEQGNIARAENFLPIKISQDIKSGTLISVLTQGIDGNKLTGKIL
ncbi:MAG: tRNA (N(6)-L-threonylcarbamoyladenosine(37)-C(2))-methylthiotransferase MtaB [Alphaproteobacteria bacterium]|nr:tRNA (N(6)-L-threonylcarbamoyladenosine(37)-C(2))-methylthiotransferase MtaB [Alphaproteobacteria bacterium]